MSKFIGYILYGIGGGMLAFIGYPFTTWQFWVISLSYIIGGILLSIDKT